ncbi:hypothetical protein QR680_014169 [Steinernema hermaphroditum]|uniref:Peptidase M13 N-terminal domain-containing protein n=1 Tax=Steinernema hermaphroditum TaxID=289476 RepID=A0AA39I7Z0_9BILA|nr:hypothetical protein QR680_014169 [Steinernema hermaphroditum]
MRLTAGLLLISFSLIPALEVPPLLDHKFSASVEPCDDFLEFVCNREENDESPFLRGMGTIFDEDLEDLLSISGGPIFEAIMPFLMEEKLKEVGRKEVLGDIKRKIEHRIVLEPHEEGYRLYIDPLAYTNLRFNLSSTHPVIQGIVNGYVKVTGHKIETVNVRKAKMLTPNSYLESAQNIVDFEERGRLVGDAVASGRQHFPKIVINGTNMEIDFRQPSEWRTYKECPATIQGLLDAYIETHKNKTIVLGNSKILLDFDIKQVEDSERRLKTKPARRRAILKSWYSAAPNVGYLSLLEYGIALDNNLISKKTRHDFERIFRAVKQEFLSTVQNTTWLAEDLKKRISDHLNSVVIEKPESATEVRTLIADMQRDFVALKNTMRTPENCNATCLSRHYMDLAAQAYSKHIKLEHYGVRGTLQIRNDSTLVAPPQYLYLTDDSIPVAHKFGRFGVAVADQLFRSVKPFLEKDSPKKFDAMQIAIGALTNDLGPGDEDLRKFFYSAALNMCQLEDPNTSLGAMKALSLFQRTFQCKCKINQLGSPDTCL